MSSLPHRLSGSHMFPASSQPNFLGGHANLATSGSDNADGQAGALAVIRRTRCSMTNV